MNKQKKLNLSIETYCDITLSTLKNKIITIMK